jgi:START domain
MLQRPRRIPNTLHSGRQWTLAAALTLYLLTPATALANETPWKLEREEQGIALYSGTVGDSPFLAVKAVAQIDAPAEKVAHLLGDGNGCSEWRAMCKSSEVLAKVSDSESLVYLVLDLPWPVSDRDLVVRSVANIDTQSKTLHVTLQSASSEHPVQDYVRAESSGEYELKVVGDTRSEFTYIQHTDIGGDLSPDLINPSMLSSTFDDIKRLQQLAEK